MKKAIGAFLIGCLMNLGFPNGLAAQGKQTHTVQAGETLYGIARNYQIHISDLLKANPQIENNSIHPGDLIQIPSLKTKSAPITPSVEKQSKPFAGASGNIHPVIKNKQFSTIEHVVKEKETLYSISKQYGVSLDDLRAWNHLEDNNIKIGSILLIKSENTLNKNETTTKPEIVEIKKPVTSDPIPVIKEQEKEKIAPPLPTPVTKPVINNRVENTNQSYESIFIEDMKTGKEHRASRGTIAWIATDNANISDSYFALHKTAPVGTIIKITNLVNKRVAFVKVIGKLPETSENLNVMLRLSGGAKNALLLNGEKAYVEMEYYQ